MDNIRVHVECIIGSETPSEVTGASTKATATSVQSLFEAARDAFPLCEKLVCLKDGVYNVAEHANTAEAVASAVLAGRRCLDIVVGQNTNSGRKHENALASNKERLSMCRGIRTGSTNDMLVLTSGNFRHRMPRQRRDRAAKR